jgi:hypothetical protein
VVIGIHEKIFVKSSNVTAVLLGSAGSIPIKQQEKERKSEKRNQQQFDKQAPLNLPGKDNLKISGKYLKTKGFG